MSFSVKTTEFLSTNEKYLYHCLEVNGEIVATLPSPLIDKKTQRKLNPYYGSCTLKSTPIIDPKIEAVYGSLSARKVWKLISALREDRFSPLARTFYEEVYGYV